MLIACLILIAGFALLIKCADILVDGSSALAKKMGISTIVIGLTIVAFGTSAPELIVNIFSSLQGSNEIAIGNIVGSNIANILLILGIAAFIRKITIKKGTIWKEIPFSLLAVLVMFFLANDSLIDGQSTSTISRIDGIILLCFFVIFLYYTFGISRAAKTEAGLKIKAMSRWRMFIYIVAGIAGLTVGGKLVVDSAITIATTLGVSQALIGLTIVAVGTSLPELVTSAVAAYKNQADIAIGNVVGSNIFNIFWILGISAIIKPLPFVAAMNFDVLAVMAATIILFLAIFVSEKNVLKRGEGVIFLLLYVCYIAYLIYRG
ncbi:TPA: sodium:proton exchanger [Candidatus Falkowbacteria bacterium]|nr:sodium:proton exchanger [Candidatus Falkowbacteria bacterium]